MTENFAESGAMCAWCVIVIWIHSVNPEIVRMIPATNASGKNGHKMQRTRKNTAAITIQITPAIIRKNLAKKPTRRETSLSKKT